LVLLRDILVNPYYRLHGNRQVEDAVLLEEQTWWSAFEIDIVEFGSNSTLLKELSTVIIEELFYLFEEGEQCESLDQGFL